MNTPLYDAVRAHARMDPAPFHMPGHKGRELPGGWPAPWVLDVTELPDTGNLYTGGDVISQSEELWAKTWRFSACQFLTGGSTQGCHAALLLCARLGEGILVDRGCHRSVYNALAMFRLKPTYLPKRQDTPVDPAEVESALARAGGSIKTFCITSPTYYGVLSDIKAIGEVCHKHDVKLVVDGAHGCHLPFLWDENPFKGADLVVTSAHKTLPVYGQGALLFSDDEETFPAADLRWAASVCGTSSPSYPIMASMDLARAYLESPKGIRDCQRAADRAEELKRAFPHLENAADPLRLTLTVNALAADGFRVKRELEAMGIFAEMADRDHLVFLISPQNTPRDFQRLWLQLESLDRDWPGVWDPPLAPAEPPEWEVVLSPAQALTAKRKTMPLWEAEGEVAAVQVAPYPPGIPVIAPGERISKKCLAYLREVGYNVHSDTQIVVDQP